MKHTAIGKVGLLILGSLVSEALMAQQLNVGSGSQIAPLRDAGKDASLVTFASNLFVEPCNTCNYDSNAGGYRVWGAGQLYATGAY